MAPGLWGRPSATIDWCEENYAITPLIAEFWNTVSNIIMIVPPLVSIFLLIKQNMEQRFIACHIGLLSVGIGSWCFHMTLLYSMQLLDELPMIWGSAFLVYAFIEVEKPPNSHNIPLQIAIFMYCFIVTGFQTIAFIQMMSLTFGLFAQVYVTLNIPVFFQISYAVMVATMVFVAARTIKRVECHRKLFVTSLVTYLSGFVLWNIDNVFCSNLRLLRKEMAGLFGPLSQLHAWWHILAGMGTYLALIFVAHTRCVVLKQQAKLRMLDAVQFQCGNGIVHLPGMFIAVIFAVNVALCYITKRDIEYRKLGTKWHLIY